MYPTRHHLAMTGQKYAKVFGGVAGIRHTVAKHTRLVQLRIDYRLWGKTTPFYIPVQSSVVVPSCDELAIAFETVDDGW